MGAEPRRGVGLDDRGRYLREPYRRAFEVELLELMIQADYIPLHASILGGGNPPNPIFMDRLKKVFWGEVGKG